MLLLLSCFTFDISVLLRLVSLRRQFWIFCCVFGLFGQPALLYYFCFSYLMSCDKWARQFLLSNKKFLLKDGSVSGALFSFPPKAAVMSIFHINNDFSDYTKTTRITNKLISMKTFAYFESLFWFSGPNLWSHQPLVQTALFSQVWLTHMTGSTVNSRQTKLTTSWWTWWSIW